MRSTRLPSWTERLLGLDPLQSPPHVFLIGREELLYGRFSETESGYALQELRRMELPPETFQPGVLGGPLRDPGAFATTVGEFLGRLSASLDEASLIVPDAWLRVTFTDIEELPRSGEARREVLQWKLRRLVPFRVEKLRLQGVEVASLPAQRDSRRMLLAFALDRLIGELEAAFGRCQVRLGSITNRTLSIASALGGQLVERDLAALVVVEGDGYTLLFCRRGEPVLYRNKALDRGLGAAQLAQQVSRDLRLTRAFLSEHLPRLPLQRVLLVAEPGEAPGWQEWLDAGLGGSAEVLGAAHLPLAREPSPPPWLEVAPMLGAACQEIR